MHLEHGRLVGLVHVVRVDPEPHCLGRLARLEGDTGAGEIVIDIRACAGGARQQAIADRDLRFGWLIENQSPLQVLWIAVAGGLARGTALHAEDRLARVIVHDVGTAEGHRADVLGWRDNQAEALCVLERGVAQHGHRNAGEALAGHEVDGAGGGRIVLARDGRAVEGLVGELQGSACGAREFDLEQRIARAAVPLGHDGPRDEHRR